METSREEVMYPEWFEAKRRWREDFPECAGYAGRCGYTDRRRCRRAIATHPGGNRTLDLTCSACGNFIGIEQLSATAEEDSTA